MVIQLGHGKGQKQDIPLNNIFIDADWGDGAMFFNESLTFKKWLGASKADYDNRFKNYTDDNNDIIITYKDKKKRKFLVTISGKMNPHSAYNRMLIRLTKNSVLINTNQSSIFTTGGERKWFRYCTIVELEENDVVELYLAPTTNSYTESNYQNVGVSLVALN